jgi:hypothetical protein
MNKEFYTFIFDGPPNNMPFNTYRIHSHSCFLLKPNASLVARQNSFRIPLVVSGGRTVDLANRKSTGRLRNGRETLPQILDGYRLTHFAQQAAPNNLEAIRK